ncbi:MAG: DUF433 domain-containing protein [Proteobacteria bacterium]|nr:DUF433 domain-containing protein [Pseudomonadota bacterium]
MNPENNEQEHLKRITVDPTILVGKPVIKGTRLSVQFIIGLLAHGMTAEEILTEYHVLTHEDILACLSFAAQALGDSSFIDFESSVA